MIARITRRFAQTIRFALVGLAATGTYLALSLLLLGRGVSPVATNGTAFLVSTLVSYLGHYYLTFRSDKRHQIVGLQFAGVTVGLIAVTTLIQQFLLGAGLGPKSAALVVALSYPPLSYLANSLLTFARR